MPFFRIPFPYLPAVSRSQEDIRPSRTPWYWWGLANILALCFAVASWTLCLEIFGRPDLPHNYRILLDLDRAPDFKAFAPTRAPEGSVLAPPALYAWFFDMGQKHHTQLNALYRRNFMRNFDDAHAVNYVEGTFEVLTTRPFGDSDFLPEGFAVRARAMVRPDDFSDEAAYPVVIELLVPTGEKKAILEFKPGTRFNLAKAPHLPVVMHVGRFMEGDEPTVQVSVLPIAYGKLALSDGKSVTMQVPGRVRPGSALRIFKPGDGMK